MDQWRNRRGGGAVGRLPPETSDRESFADIPGKDKEGKKEKWRRKQEKKVEN